MTYSTVKTKTCRFPETSLCCCTHIASVPIAELLQKKRKKRAPCLFLKGHHILWLFVCVSLQKKKKGWGGRTSHTSTHTHIHVSLPQLGSLSHWEQKEHEKTNGSVKASLWVFLYKDTLDTVLQEKSDAEGEKLSRALWTSDITDDTVF